MTALTKAAGNAEPLSSAALYRAHEKSVARWAARLGGPEIDVEDVVQEVFLTAHRLLSTFRGEAKVTTWLFRITENQVRYQRRKRRLRRLFRVLETADTERLASPRLTPVEELEQRQASQTVYKILDGMRDKYRTAFVLFEIEKLSGEEVAELLGQKVATIWVWLHRARAQFLERLEEHERNERR